MHVYAVKYFSLKNTLFPPTMEKNNKKNVIMVNFSFSRIPTRCCNLRFFLRGMAKTSNISVELFNLF